MREWVRGRLADRFWSGSAEWGGHKVKGEGQLPLLKMGLS